MTSRKALAEVCHSQGCIGTTCFTLHKHLLSRPIGGTKLTAEETPRTSVTQRPRCHDATEEEGENISAGSMTPDAFMERRFLRTGPRDATTFRQGFKTGGCLIKVEE